MLLEWLHAGRRTKSVSDEVDADLLMVYVELRAKVDKLKQLNSASVSKYTRLLGEAEETRNRVKRRRQGTS